jgi:hypothetical protein
MKRERRYFVICAAACLATSIRPALALDSFSPSNAVCGLVNFSFCDQGTQPSAPAPSSSGLAPGRPLPPPPGAGGFEDRAAKSQVKRSEKEIAAKASGNCANGWFTTPAGERLQFIGPAKRRLEGDPRYVILHDGLRMEDNTASGYRVALQQFKRLCPKRVPVADE